MYTHLPINRKWASVLYPWAIEGAAQLGDTKLRDYGVIMGVNLDDHFARYGQAFIRRLGCAMEFERTTSLFSLRFRKYLPEVPQALQCMGIEIVGAEIVRFQSAPTRARAGFYHWTPRNATATVERVFPTQHDQYKKPIPLYAQNIHVRAQSLKDAQEFNSKLSQGHFNRFLVDPWE